MTEGVRKLDVVNEKLIMIDGTVICFKHIKEINGDIFNAIIKQKIFSIKRESICYTTGTFLFKRISIGNIYLLCLIMFDNIRNFTI